MENLFAEFEDETSQILRRVMAAKQISDALKKLRAGAERINDGIRSELAVYEAQEIINNA